MSNSSFFTSEDLRSHLKTGNFDVESLLQIHIIQRRAHFFSGLPNGTEREMLFRKAIAADAEVSINEVTIVGSAQSGYSIKPGAELRPMDEIYRKTQRESDKSDIDVSIVSEKYFNKVKEEVRNFTQNFSNSWIYSKYYPTDSDLEHLDVPRADYQFYRYLAQGWLRPDFCPLGFTFAFDKTKSTWRKQLSRKVSIAIYRDWPSLKNYQITAFEKMRLRATRGSL